MKTAQLYWVRGYRRTTWHRVPDAAFKVPGRIRVSALCGESLSPADTRDRAPEGKPVCADCTVQPP